MKWLDGMNIINVLLVFGDNIGEAGWGYLVL
jgi:hypothetical protein